MGFIKFRGRSRAAEGVAMISVLKGGQLGINNASLQKYFEGFDFADLYYDKDRRVIGVQPVKEATGDSYSIRRSKDGKTANISARAFLKNFRLVRKTTKAYPTAWNDEEKLVEVYLNQQNDNDTDNDDNNSDDQEDGCLEEGH